MPEREGVGKAVKRQMFETLAAGTVGPHGLSTLFQRRRQQGHQVSVPVPKTLPGGLSSQGSDQHQSLNNGWKSGIVDALNQIEGYLSLKGHFG